MTMTQITCNPFAQMLDLQAVISAVESSERLQRLNSRICRPLDRILVTASVGEAADHETDADEAGDDAGSSEAA